MSKDKIINYGTLDKTQTLVPNLLLKNVKMEKMMELMNQHIDLRKKDVNQQI